MKHSNPKLSNPRRIAAHLITTSAIAILGAQSAAAVTVFNPTVTGVSDIAGACRISVRASLFKTPGEDYRLEIHNNGRILAKVVPLAATGSSAIVDNKFMDIPDSAVQYFSQGSMQVKWAADNSAKQPRGTANVQTSALTSAGGTCADVATALTTPPANRAPVARASADQNLLADFTGSGTAQTVTVNAATSSDADGDALTYTWTQISGPATTRVTGALSPLVLMKKKVVVGSSRAQFNQPASAGTVVYRVTATDPSGESDSDDVSIVWGANTPPTTTAPSVQNPSGPVLVGASVQLSSGTSTSASGGGVTYSWVQTGGPSVTLSDPSSPNPTFPAPAAGGAVTFALTVNDGISATTTTVTANLVIDQTPVANAGADQTLVDVARGTVVTLDGTNSVDPDNGTLTYAWTQISGPSVTLSDATAAQPTFTYPAQGGGLLVVKQKGGDNGPAKGAPADTLIFELIVSDGASTSAPDQVSIIINTNDLPTANAGADQTLYGQANGDTFTLAGSGSDPDGDTLTYAWTQTAGRTLTISDASSATPTVTYDGAGTAGVDDVFTFSLITNDGSSDSAADEVSFTLKDNRIPIADAGADQTPINAGAIVTLNGTGSSDADGDALTYTWSQVSGTSVTLSSTSAASPTFTAPDVASLSSLVFQLIISDGKVDSPADTVTIGVQPTGTITIIQTVQGSDNRFAFTSPIAALNSAVQTVNGTGQLFADDVNTGSYTVTAADMKAQGYALTALSCNDGDSTTDLGARRATINVAPGENVTCTFSVVNSREAASKAIQEYLTTRNTLILSHQPSRGRRLDRLKGQSASGSVVAGGLALPGASRLPLQASMTDGGASLSTSLNSVRAMGGSKGAGSVDIWGEAQFSNFTLGAKDGNFSIIYGGVDYLANDTVLIGALVQLDKFEQNTMNNIGSGSGDGYMVGPYITAKISDNVYVDARAAWGNSDNSINPLGSFSDDFETSRALLSASVVGELPMGDGVILSPTLSLRHLGETQDGYTDSLGVTVPSQDVSQGELSFAPRLESTIALNNGWTMRPYGSIEGIYSFGDYVSPVLGSETRARGEGGVDWQSETGVSAGISAYIDGIGSDKYEATGLRLRLSYTMQ